jgi:hypothetical protein
MDISLIGNSALRIAIQRNLVSFPSQIPAFTKRPGGDTRERMAQLYFALGWTVRSLCERYGLSKTMVQKLLAEWRIRAVAAGYIQDIHPEDLDVLVSIREDGDMPLPPHAKTTAAVAVQLLPSGSREMAAHASMQSPWH